MLKHHNGSVKRLRHFLRGIGSVLDIMPSSEGLADYKLQDFCIVDDQKALYADFLAVANDFSKSYHIEIRHLKHAHR